MIQFIVVSSFFLQDYISFIFSLVFFFVVFSFGVVVLIKNSKPVEQESKRYKLLIFYRFSVESEIQIILKLELLDIFS